MDRRYSSYFQFSTRQYEGHLSLFGKKVLETLVKKWTADRNRNQNRNSTPFESPGMPPPTPHSGQSKKVLTFLCNEPRVPQLPQALPITYAETTSSKNNGIYEYINTPSVPTTNELVKTVESTKNGIDAVKILTDNSKIDEVNVSTYDIINSVIDENEGIKMLHDFCNRPHLDDEDDAIDTKDTARIDSKFTPVIGPRVNWDDMFDTELLPDVSTNAKLMIQHNVKRTTAEKIFNIAFSDHAIDHDSEKIDDIQSIKAKKVKRKTQPNDIDVIPKKAKKLNETDKPKISFRKQTYKKAVKNWLIDVNPSNPVVREVTNYDNSVEKFLGRTSKQKNNVKENSVSNTNIDFKKIKEKPIKVVQAQLANKDGKMKFDKPKDKTKTELISDKIENNKTKDKNNKPKFVAPIKSQLPVKEVDYKVVTVDDTNILGHTESLRQIENKDLNIVLVYSNGFCQLNKHHTEESCDPEGLIIAVEEQFYFLKGNHQSFKEVIKLILERNNVICYEGKSLFIFFKSKFGLEFNNLTIIDAKIGGSLLDPDNPPDNFSDLQKLLSYTPQYTIATESVLQKTAWYVTQLDECSVKLSTLLKENGLWSVFVEIEMKLIPIIAEMEHRGVTVDLQKLKSMEDILLCKMKEMEQECHKAAGKSFQLMSTAQVRAIVYDELQLDTRCNVKIKETICKGAKSTSETMLRSLVSVHPLPKLILEYRHLHKAHATFLKGIAQQVIDGVVRPSWVQMAAATGRIASNNPNLQAIPKAPFSLTLFSDENNSGQQSLSIRSVYTARGGWSLLAADFQHVECRVFAHCAADATLLEALQGPADLFRALAAKWLNKPESEISSEDRERTKRMVYASLYGAGCRKLMDILGVSYEQTLSIIASFNRTFPSLKSFGRSVVSRCEQNGGRLATLCGRGRLFKNIASQDFQLKSQAERQAVNFVVQGSAADLCKMAMVLTSSRLRAHRPPVACYLLLQIHDELVWEVRDEHLHTAAAIIKEAMEGCGQHCGMATPLPVRVSAGGTWADMDNYAPPLMQ